MKNKHNKVGVEGADYADSFFEKWKALCLLIRHDYEKIEETEKGGEGAAFRREDISF